MCRSSHCTAKYTKLGTFFNMPSRSFQGCYINRHLVSLEFRETCLIPAAWKLISILLEGFSGSGSITNWRDKHNLFCLRFRETEFYLKQRIRLFKDHVIFAQKLTVLHFNFIHLLSTFSITAYRICRSSYCITKTTRCKRLKLYHPPPFIMAIFIAI